MKLTNQEIVKVLTMYLCRTAKITYWFEETSQKEITIELLHKYLSVGQGNFQIKKIEMHLIPLEKISDEDAIEVAKIVCGRQYIEVDNVVFANQPTVKDDHTIYKISFTAYQIIKHTGDKPKEFLLYINSWGTINLYVNGELSNNRYDCFIWQYLISKGYAVPLFFAPNHWANGKTAIELGLAIDKTLN